MQTTDFREQRGEAIARQFGAVRRIDETSYKVHAQSGDFEYDVMQGELGWLCSCPDALFRLNKCKHVWAVELSFILRKVVAREPTVIQPVSVKDCPYCKSEGIIKKSVRHNRSGDIQRFMCKGCGKRFSFNLGFVGMRATPQIITSAMQLYFTGESFRGVRNFLRLQGANFSHQSVYAWVKKYTKLMEGYLEQITPQVSDTWRADELYVKIRGDTKYLFAIMDDETRFWIAQQVSDSKYAADVRPMFAEAREKAGKRPLTLITDGGHHFERPFKQEFQSNHGHVGIHIRDIRFDGTVHNNKMERMNGEIRDREKVMRGLKREDTPILKGYQLYHNFIRPHEALNGKTPADRCGIRVEGDNKWLTLIQNASRPDKKAT